MKWCVCCTSKRRARSGGVRFGCFTGGFEALTDVPSRPTTRSLRKIRPYLRRDRDRTCRRWPDPSLIGRGRQRYPSQRRTQEEIHVPEQQPPAAAITAVSSGDRRLHHARTGRPVLLDSLVHTELPERQWSRRPMRGWRVQPLRRPIRRLLGSNLPLPRRWRADDCRPCSAICSS
jgi:hypothetical protein